MRAYLKRLRKKQLFSQAEIAMKLDMSQQYYNMIENGSRQNKMGSDLIFKLAKCFDVSAEYILQEEQKLQDVS